MYMPNVCVHAQLCLTLCDPMECSLPGSSVWDFPGKDTRVGSISSSSGSSQPKDQTCCRYNHILKHCKLVLCCRDYMTTSLKLFIQ